MDLKGLKSYEIDELEPCFIVEKGKKKIYIPKLMPLKKNGVKKLVKQNIKLNLVNDSTCMPSYSKNITVQSFITAKTFDGTKYSGLKKGQRMLCHIINRNPTHIYLAEKKF